MALLGRQSLFGMAVLAATGVPYAVHSVTENGTQPASTEIRTATDPTTPTEESRVMDAPIVPGDPRQTLPLEGPTVFNLGEVFNFDVTTAWVLGRWPRVMTSGWGENWHAYRVPVVTGARDHDLAGSLTYYFDPDQKVEWITFVGSTGDARPLVDFLSRQHGLQRSPSKPGEYVYEKRNNGEAESQLVIKPQPVQRADASHARFAVEMRLNRPVKSQPWYAPVDKKTRSVNLQ